MSTPSETRAAPPGFLEIARQSQPRFSIPIGALRPNVRMCSFAGPREASRHGPRTRFFYGSVLPILRGDGPRQPISDPFRASAGDRRIPGLFFFRTILFKLFNRVETGQLLESTICSIAPDLGCAASNRVLSDAMGQGRGLTPQPPVVPRPGELKARASTRFISDCSKR